MTCWKMRPSGIRLPTADCLPATTLDGAAVRTLLLVLLIVVSPPPPLLMLRVSPDMTRPCSAWASREGLSCHFNLVRRVTAAHRTTVCGWLQVLAVLIRMRFCGYGPGERRNTRKLRTSPAVPPKQTTPMLAQPMTVLSI